MPKRGAAIRAGAGFSGVRHACQPRPAPSGAVAAAPKWADAVDAVRVRMTAVLAANLIMLMRVSPVFTSTKIVACGSHGAKLEQAAGGSSSGNEFHVIVEAMLLAASLIHKRCWP